MALRIESGHPLFGDDKPAEGNAVRFIAEDGHTMFDVTAGKDGRSIEVRAVDVTSVDGKLFGARIEIRPNAANSVTIRVPPYGDG